MKTTVYGDFPTSFASDRLANLCEPEDGVQTGPFGSQLHQHDYVAVGTPIITVEHLGDNRVEHRDVPYVSDEDRNRLSKYQLRKGDIVFSRVGSVDRRALVGDAEAGWLFSGRCLRVRPDKSKIDPAYLSYFFGLTSFKEHIRAIAVGATMPSLNTQILSSVPVLYPKNLNEQRAIAHILGTLDDKIELNRRMNETLEAMVQAIFKSWFVDFDPVRAKAAGHDPGLPRAMSDLFPDLFEDSEKGAIPAGWGIKTVDDVAECVAMGPFGSSIKVETFVPEGIPVISGQHLCGLMLEDNTFNFVTPEHAKRLGHANVQRGDVIFTHAGSIGQAALIPETSRYERYVISQRQFYMRCDLSYVTPTFIALYFNSPQGRHQLLANTSSSGVPSIARPVTYLRTIRLPIPKRPVLDAFERLVSPLLLRISQNMETNRTLATLRDTLLPKLVSGQIRIARSQESPAWGTPTSAEATQPIYTIGHSNHSLQDFIKLLRQHNITAIADVRSSPFSRRNPQFNQTALSSALTQAGIAYVFLGKELGGRPDDPGCYDNGSADFSRIAERTVFKEGITRLLRGIDKYRIALLCAEREPLDCHRTILVCRELRRLGLPIKHILADGCLEDHQETERRLVRTLGLEPNLFDRRLTEEDRTEEAYNRRSKEIAYRSEAEEFNHDHSR